jgi:hypothetical protein
MDSTHEENQHGLLPHLGAPIARRLRVLSPFAQMVL